MTSGQPFRPTEREKKRILARYAAGESATSIAASLGARPPVEVEPLEEPELPAFLDRRRAV